MVKKVNFMLFFVTTDKKKMCKGTVEGYIIVKIFTNPLLLWAPIRSTWPHNLLWPLKCESKLNVWLLSKGFKRLYHMALEFPFIMKFRIARSWLKLVLFMFKVKLANQLGNYCWLSNIFVFTSFIPWLWSSRATFSSSLFW